MKKFVIYLLVLVAVGIVAYTAYRIYLPSTIAESLKSGQKSSLVPDELQEKVTALKTSVARDVGNLPDLMAEASIDYDDLQTMLDRLDPAEVTSALREISSVDITSTGQAFDIVKKHVSIEGYDLEVFRDMFIRNSSVEDVRKAIDNIREYEFFFPVGIPVAKEVARDLLEASRLEIEKRLAALESS